MNLMNLWLNFFRRTEFLGINIGFWAVMSAVLLIVIAMNVIFWSMKPVNNKKHK